ncbi:MAG TPA: response regulator [Candidatus Cloacimonadota bacterium]|jgi:chemotaxis response regulator CheB|nr:response regulator [Candidatus Cloacimonadota bacterium]HOD54178.1 response regulator [Candidatus Cloacimonadota bacterium]
MGINILIVDDNSMMRGFLEKFVKKEPAIENVWTAENGKIAIDMALQYHPDVILTDVEMPVMDGLEELKEIKNLQRSGQLPATIKVIVLSGTMFENDANVRKAKFLGAYQVLAKPDGKSMSFAIDGAKLIETIKDAAQKK